MRRRILAPLLALILALTTGGVVFAVNYFGEDFCQDAKAWPGGSYLGQMHPFHVEIYSAHAGVTGHDPVTSGRSTSAIPPSAVCGSLAIPSSDPASSRGRNPRL